MSIENPAELNQSNNEELPKTPDDLPAVPDPENTEQAQEGSVEEEIAEMSNAQLAEYFNQINLDFSTAALREESLRDIVVDDADAEYILAKAERVRIQKKKE